MVDNKERKRLVVFCAFAVIFLFFGKYVVDVSSNYYHNIESHKSSINRIDLKRLEELSSFAISDSGIVVL